MGDAVEMPDMICIPRLWVGMRGLKGPRLEAGAPGGGAELPLLAAPKQSWGGKGRSHVQLGNEGVNAPGGARACQVQNLADNFKELRI